MNDAPTARISALLQKLASPTRADGYGRAIRMPKVSQTTMRFF